MDTLPNECIYHIITRVMRDPRSLITLGSVSREFYAHCNKDDLWKLMLRRDFLLGIPDDVTYIRRVYNAPVTEARAVYYIELGRSTDFYVWDDGGVIGLRRRDEHSPAPDALRDGEIRSVAPSETGVFTVTMGGILLHTTSYVIETSKVSLTFPEGHGAYTVSSNATVSGTTVVSTDGEVYMADIKGLWGKVFYGGPPCKDILVVVAVSHYKYWVITRSCHSAIYSSAGELLSQVSDDIIANLAPRGRTVDDLLWTCLAQFPEFRAMTSDGVPVTLYEMLGKKLRRRSENM